MTVSIERSDDDGVTWRPDSSVGLGGGIWKNKSGATVSSAQWRVTLTDDTNALKKIRISADVQQSCTLGITVDA